MVSSDEKPQENRQQRYRRKLKEKQAAARAAQTGSDESVTLAVPEPAKSDTGTKRGRPPKARAGTPPPATGRSFADTLSAAHTMASMATGVPELRLTPDESRRLADAWGPVLDRYEKSGVVQQLGLITMWGPPLVVTTEIEARVWSDYERAMRGAMQARQQQQGPPPFVGMDAAEGQQPAPAPENGSGGLDAETGQIFRDMGIDL